MRILHALLAAGVMLGALPLEAQKAQLSIVLPERAALASEGPAISSSFLVSDGATHDLLRNGFPARIHYTLERWSTQGWFDNVAARTEWDVVVRYDSRTSRFTVHRVLGERTAFLGSFATIAAADSALGSAFVPPVRLPGAGQGGYYTLAVEIEALSLTELDEVERWLRGDLEPAVKGHKNAGTAVGRGVRTVVVRLLGGEKRRYQARSRTFRA